jgi:hypothetical protein
MLFADQQVHRGANLNGAGRGRAHRRGAGRAGVPHPEALGHLPDRLSVIQPPTQPGLPAADTSDKKFNSRLVVPIISSVGEKRAEGHALHRRATAAGR